MLIHRIYMEEVVLPDVLIFDWDEGNSTKSWVKHKVSQDEQEQAFFTKKKILIEDKKHSEQERRFLMYSKTSKERKLIIAFTIRTIDKQQKIRPISARPMNREEARLYEETLKVA